MISTKQHPRSFPLYFLSPGELSIPRSFQTLTQLPAGLSSFFYRRTKKNVGNLLQFTCHLRNKLLISKRGLAKFFLSTCSRCLMRCLKWQVRRTSHNQSTKLCRFSFWIFSIQYLYSIYTCLEKKYGTCKSASTKAVLAAACPANISGIFDDSRIPPTDIISCL